MIWVYKAPLTALRLPPSNPGPPLCDQDAPRAASAGLGRRILSVEGTLGDLSFFEVTQRWAPLGDILRAVRKRKNELFI